MPSELSSTNLFKPIKVGHITLQNRLVHGPCTRMRNSDDSIPTDSMLDYYTERAENNGGLLIAEGTLLSPDFGVMPNTPQLDTSRQVEAWAKIVEGIHKADSFAGIQLWNLGRESPVALNKAKKVPYWAASPVYKDEAQKKAAEDAGYPLKEMTTTEIKWMVQQYASAARKAIEVAKFDLVELHAGHLFLPDQFFQRSANTRTDEYGGSLENRSRFILEVVDALIDAVGADHVGVKLTPYSTFEKGVDEKLNPVADFEYLAGELEKRAEKGNRLAYIFIIEPRISGDMEKETYDKNEHSVWLEKAWKGLIVRAGALLHDEKYEELKRYVDSNDRTLIGAGRYFTSNPDLVTRLKKGLPLTKYDRPSFYTPGTNKGFLGWPKYGEEKVKEVKEGLKELA